MKRATQLGTLAATVAISVLGAGVSVASPVPPSGGRGESAATVPDGVFKPGPNTVVKLNADYSGPAASGGSKSPAAVQGVRPADTLVPTVKKIRYLGQVCGTTRISQTSGAGKTTLVLTVEKSVEVLNKKEAAVDLKYVSAGMGWDVTKKYGVKDETRYEVPRGRFGNVIAYPVYDQYLGQAYERFGNRIGQVYSYKPVGVCFNQYLD